MQFGQRQMMESAQRIQPVPKGTTSDIRQSAGRRLATRGGGAGLPPFMFQMPSNRPSEPVTAGLAMGPGPGPEALMASEPPPDVREQVLMYLVQAYGNADAAEMLSQFRSTRAVQAQAQAAPAAPLQ